MAAKRGLGKGLGAIFGEEVIKEQKEKIAMEDGKGKELMVKLSLIQPNKEQPRKTFDQEKLKELSASIKRYGILQPLLVKKNGNFYEIIAGERRWRAARKAGLSEVPCLIRELTDEQNMLIAIIENMQREDLNPIEEAEGLHQMITSFGLTQEQVSKSVGKSRPYIANSLRLLKLPEYIKERLSEGVITTGHGRTLITIEDEKIRKQICDKIISEGLSVRETEKLVAEIGKPAKKRPAQKTKNPNTIRVEAELKEIFGTKVNILQSGKKGKIEIECYGKDEMDRLIELLKKLA